MDDKTPKRSKRLGRGLSALIPEVVEEVDKKDIVNIKLNSIYPNNNQPRRVFDEESLAVLANSIKSFGILQPIVVKPDEDGKYMIIAGERRYRAAKIAKLSEIPAVIKDISIKEVKEIALIENLQRENLNPIEEALAYKDLIEEHKLKQEEISEIVGKSRPYITNTLRLLNLKLEVRQMIENNIITAGHGKTLLRLNDLEEQLRIANKIVEEKLSVRQTEEIIKKIIDDSNKTPKKPKKEKDIFIVDIEERLRNILGTKVNISQGKKKGKIEIEYYNDEDLNDIISRLLEED